MDFRIFGFIVFAIFIESKQYYEELEYRIKKKYQTKNIRQNI